MDDIPFIVILRNTVTNAECIRTTWILKDDIEEAKTHAKAWMNKPGDWTVVDAEHG